MPPLLMTALFSLLLSLVAPQSSVNLPHVSKVERVVATTTLGVQAPRTRHAD